MSGQRHPHGSWPRAGYCAGIIKGAEFQREQGTPRTLALLCWSSWSRCSLCRRDLLLASHHRVPWLGVLYFCVAVFPQASLVGALFTLPQCNCRGTGVLRGLGANIKLVIRCSMVAWASPSIGTEGSLFILPGLFFVEHLDLKQPITPLIYHG
jgi:hypothetical protein